MKQIFVLCAFVFLVMFPVPGWFQSASASSIVPAPDVSIVHAIDTQYVKNTRGKDISISVLNEILRRAEVLIFQLIGVRVQFHLIESELTTEEMLGSISANELSLLRQSIVDFRSFDASTRETMIKSAVSDLRETGQDHSEAIQFALPYLLKKPSSESIEDFTSALVDTQISRLKSWHACCGSLNERLIDDSAANEYFIWRFFIAKKSKAKLVVTNQLIASAELFDTSIHSAIRGGLTNGVTGASASADGGVASVVSFFAFFSDDSTTMALRDGKFDGTAQQMDAAALMVAHEIGHQIGRFGHPFGQKACVMNPPTLLHFKAWVNGINAEACPVGSNRAMTRGAVQFQNLKGTDHLF